MAHDAARRDGPALWVAAVLAIAAVIVRALSTGVPEMGDGVQHYEIAKHAWHHPLLFLDQWGKPLFTLLASPFAQAGPVGVVLFNALLAWITCWCGVRVLSSQTRVVRTAFVVVVMTAPAYWAMVISGMTEILFATLTVITVLMLVRGSAGKAALVASFTPLARPEYIAFLPCIALWLLLERRWRALPLCLAGLVVQGLFTTFAFHDPFWFWTHTPYGDGPSVYGSGSWWHFLHYAPEIFGWPLLVAFVLALLAWYPLQQRDTTQQRTHRVLLITTAVPVLLTTAAHSWAWWKGVHGSAGVTRVLATVVPLAAVFAMHTLGRGYVTWAAPRVNAFLLGTLTLVLSAWGAITTFRATVPIPENEGQRPLDEAAFRLRALRTPDVQVFSTHPFAAFRADLDPYNEAQYRTVWSLQGKAAKDYFPPRALIFWDSQLGPNESQLPLDSLFPSSSFVLEGIWHPRIGYRVVGDVPYAVYLFRCAPNTWMQHTDTLLAPGRAGQVRVVGDSTAEGFGAAEFPLSIDPLPAPDTMAAFEEWEFRANFHAGAEADMRLVFKRTNGDELVRYEEKKFGEGPVAERWRVPVQEVATQQLIYLWDPARHPFTLTDVLLIRHRWTQHPVR